MFDYPAPLLIAIIATFFAAGIIKGVTGMGLPTVSMAILGSLLSPLTAAAILLVPSFVTNAWQLSSGPQLGSLARRLWPMMMMILLGTIAGSFLLTGSDTHMSTAALGLALSIYAAYTLLAKPFHVAAHRERWLSPIIGLATGLLTGATGVFVIPAVPYIQSLELDRDDLVQALGLSFTVSTVALAIGLSWHGAVPLGNLFVSTVAIAPALLGMAVGQFIRTRISPPLFRRVFLIFLLLLGMEMAFRSFF
ncbi:putative permease [uncultured Sphingopyxis sp.]|uniref:Probable membrane transporter protein n=1 Tax=uncultured Sphingopyxis sp. TaxID=310581 RepID=A0A1Y5PUP3_9SPHN|nr:sulfite exporter TauE/SafE family protein [uncultured Sphingopyxis sp.]SBV32345.1 putative permease [uncultured Sphingopyxis sp.]